ncbi:basic phospholipase A2 homolog ammodytin L-like [Leptodactylus fuscus]|uniref:basic phospholipase A2 homolog ammodytin L-like n=1 Tax=Leptodactylus fuscus TaxID=238119 RepID=UPI003F4F383D
MASFKCLSSSVSVDVSGQKRGKFSDMIKKVLDRKKSDFTFYGCQCGIFRGTKIVDEIDRCCHRRVCCFLRIAEDVCKRLTTPYYYYSYENGTITCNDEDVSSCARQVCECDKAAVLCIKSQKYIEEHRRYVISRKCKGLSAVC